MIFIFPIHMAIWEYTPFADDPNFQQEMRSEECIAAQHCLYPVMIAQGHVGAGISCEGSDGASLQASQTTSDTKFPQESLHGKASEC